MKVLKKILLIAVTFLLSVLTVALLAWSALHVAKYFIYPEYYRNAEVVSAIPGLNDGFRPQGVFYDEESDAYIHSGSKGEYAALYVVDKNGKVRELIPRYREKDEQSVGRGGAVVRVGDYVYICDNENQNNSINGILYIFSYSDIMRAKDGDTVLAIGHVDTDCAMSAMFTDGDYLYVAEFYQAGTNYSTHQSHHYTTPAGISQKAMLFAYALNEDGTLVTTVVSPSENASVEEAEAILLPAFAVSISDQVTGFAIKDGTVILTRGENWKYATLEFYSGWRSTNDTVKVSKQDIPIYYIDSKDRIESVDLPLCAGNMTLANDRVVITFESASNYYVIGKFFFAYNLTSYPIPKSK